MVGERCSGESADHASENDDRCDPSSDVGQAVCRVLRKIESFLEVAHLEVNVTLIGLHETYRHDARYVAGVCAMHASGEGDDDGHEKDIAVNDCRWSPRHLGFVHQRAASTACHVLGLCM